MERIALSNQTFEGNNNVYVFDDEETTLVDTGDHLPGTFEQLEDGLADHGVSVEDVDRVLLTHWHGDHAGLAERIQDRSGAAVFVHEADAALVAGDEEAWHDLRERQTRAVEAWGMPDEKREILLAFLDENVSATTGPRVTPFEDGETFPSVGLEAVHAPGHTAGLCTFVDREQNVVYSGDALLPKYTPNVGGADVRVDRPLAQYLETLGTLADADYDRAYPGHRDTIEDPTARARDIVTHHEERSWRVLDALDRHGPCDPWTVSADLFGSLEGIHILHGPGESYAHLDHLEHEGLVVREGDEYDLADGVASRLDGEDGRWPLV